jgi:hypothetical protein
MLDSCSGDLWHREEYLLAMCHVPGVLSSRIIHAYSERSVDKIAGQLIGHMRSELSIFDDTTEVTKDLTVGL